MTPYDISPSELLGRLRSPYGINQHSLREAESILKNYESKILQQDDTLSEAQASDMQRHIQRLRSLTSPIRQIPPEILSRIFEETRKGMLREIGWDCCIDIGAGCPALTLTWVSKSWRDVALTTPLIWSSISVWLTSTDSDTFNIHQDLLTAVLSRSHPSPLRELRIVFPDDCDISEHGLLRLKCLTDCSDRWRDVTFSINVNTLACSDHLGVCRVHLPNLNKLSLLSRDWGPGSEADSEGVRLPIDFFEDAPNLRYLELTRDRNTPLLSTDIPRLPWQQFHRIKVKKFDFEETLRWVSFAPRLKTLDIRDPVLTSQEGEESQQRLPRSLHQFESVTTLKTTHSFASFNAPFPLDYLTLPNLESLTLYSGFMDDFNPDFQSWEPNLRRFITRSSCNIHSLSLKELFISDMDAITILRMTPQVRILSIQEINYLSAKRTTLTRAFLKKLVRASSSRAQEHISSNVLDSIQTLVPYLESLELDLGIGIDNEWLSTIAEVQKSRQILDEHNVDGVEVAYLKSFSLIFQCPEGSSVSQLEKMEGFKASRAVGVKFSESWYRLDL